MNTMQVDVKLQINLLWQRVLTGDRAAFKVIHRYYHNRLLRYGAFYCKDQSTIEDVIQDLFLLLWDKKQTIRIKNLDAYIFAAFKNNMLLRLKRQDRQLSETADYASTLDAHDINIEDLIIIKEMEDSQKHLLFEEIERLPKRQQEVIFLRYYQDLSYKEIAEIMEIDYQTARNFASRALKKLRQHISRFDEILYMIFLLWVL